MNGSSSLLFEDSSVIPFEKNLKDSVEETPKDLTYCRAILLIIKYALPSCFGLVLRKLVDNINFYFIGKMDQPDYISGAGLAMLTLNITVISLGIGLSGGVETLSSQAFGSGKNYLAGCYYNRAQVIMAVMFIFQAIILFFSEDLLVLCGQPKMAAKIAGDFIIKMIPGVWIVCQTELLRRFLTSQGVLYIVVNSQILSCILHTIWLYLFIDVYGFGLDGVVYATTITYVLSFILPVLYITFYKEVLKPQSWHCINGDSFTGLLEYLEFGVPSMIMLLLEVWGFEVLTLIAGTLGENELGASIICVTFDALIYQIALGMSIALSSLIGNNLGSGRIRNSQIFINLATCMPIIFFVIVAYFYIFQGEAIARLFTEDQTLIDLIVSTFPIFVLHLLGDYIQTCHIGSIKAMGYQKYATVVCLLSFWLVSFPLTYVFTYIMDLRLTGVFLGIAVGYTVHAAVFLILIYTTNMKKLSVKIQKRLECSNRALNANGLRNVVEFSEMSDLLNSS
ncbi:unnamed protein product [Moneuplotes crassus]|uniref:Uncharacterized protein n=1 Tax=Euplotes crassus TaxID=5936 RepID=A0AAD1UBP8_EUPCR|nr:unnamed protein product [Moneuplotes crassus]